MKIRSEQRSTMLAILAFAVIGFGIYLRAMQYAVGRSLWFDEALLALNIVNRSFIQLTELLDNNQGAPLGFLFIEKSIILIFGNKDYILRLFPFFAGIVSIFLMYFATKKYVGLRETPIALVLFAVCARLVYYSSEVKQYSSDVMITLILILIAHKCIGANANSRHYIVLGIVGALSFLFSHPALFVMAGICLSLTVDVLIGKDRNRYLNIGIMYFLLIVSFTALYFFSLRILAENKSLITYWGTSFMPLPPWSDLGWFRKSFVRLLISPVGMTNVLVGTPLIFLGCFSIIYRNWRLAIILTAPFLAVLVASGFERYPFRGRLLLFSVPVVILLAVEGLNALYLYLRKFNSTLAVGAWAIMAGLLLQQPIGTAYLNLENQRMPEHIKPVMQYIAQNRRDNDLIYVHYGAMPAFRYYAPSFDLEHVDYVLGTSAPKPEKYIDGIHRTISYGRVWYLFSHVSVSSKMNSLSYFLQHLEENGVKIDQYKSSGAFVYLYQFSRPS